MSDFTPHFLLLLRVVLVFVVPAVILYFRIRKKITTGTTLWFVATSILLSLFTFYNYSNPVDDFEQYMKNGDMKKAKIAMKQIAQMSKINRVKILQKFKSSEHVQKIESLRVEIISEYNDIVKSYLKKFTINKTIKCTNYKKQKLINIKLHHARTLLTYAKNLGSTNVTLDNKLKSVLKKSDETVKRYEKECGKTGK